MPSLEELAKELEQLKGDPNLIAFFKQHVQNRKILDPFKLNPHNQHHLQYWSKQVIKFGGCDYNGYRIPHTVANIFTALQQEPVIDSPTEKLLEEIHIARKQSSGSRMSFFGLPAMRSEAVEKLRIRPGEDFLQPINSSFSLIA